MSRLVQPFRLSRMLVVDADLRKPQMHHRLGSTISRASATCSPTTASTGASCIKPVPNHRDWALITAGRIRPDPSRLLSSKRMADLLQTLACSGADDVVLYDAPPVLGLAEAALVAEQLDGDGSQLPGP